MGSKKREAMSVCGFICFSQLIYFDLESTIGIIPRSNFYPGSLVSYLCESFSCSSRNSTSKCCSHVGHWTFKDLHLIKSCYVTKSKATYLT
jgi:hypothetical protein